MKKFVSERVYDGLLQLKIAVDEKVYWHMENKYDAVNIIVPRMS